MSFFVQHSHSSNLRTYFSWELSYTQELNNFSDHGDIGEVWFGRGTERRLVTWLERNVDKGSSVLDLGCGNGHLLLQLADVGFVCLTGVDYVPEAVHLARLIQGDGGIIRFEVGDVLGPAQGCLARQYDVVLDKGTYDAIGLCSVDPAGKRRRYREAILRLLGPRGRFLLASCNWTAAELTDYFAPCLQVEVVIPTPTMVFKGKSGATTTCLVFGRPPSKDEAS